MNLDHKGATLHVKFYFIIEKDEEVCQIKIKQQMHFSI